MYYWSFFCSQVLLFNTNNSIQHNLFICTQSNGSKYWCIIPTIQFLLTVKLCQESLCPVKLCQESLCNTNNSIQHSSFVRTQLNDFKYWYVTQAIQFIFRNFALLALTLAGTVQQRRTWSRISHSFGWPTFGWVSCITDTIVILYSTGHCFSTEAIIRHTCLDPDLGPCPARLIRPTLH